MEVAAVSQGTATFAAALVAAVAAVSSLVVTTIAAYRREMRDAQRQALQPHLALLADAIHQTVATSFNQQKARTPQAADRWRARGKEAAAALEKTRLAVRYPLPGLDEGLNNLRRVPDWVAHRRGRPEIDELLAQADALASALHTAIEKSWRRGQPPGWLRRRRLDRQVKSLRATAPIGPKTDVPAEPELK